MATKKASKPKQLMSTVLFFDKSGKEIYKVETHDRVPKSRQFAKLFPVVFENAVLVTCQPEPKDRAKLRIFKDVVAESGASETARTKLKKLGANI